MNNRTKKFECCGSVGLPFYNVLIVLGGYASRALCALDLYHQGVAQNIIISGSSQNIQESLSILNSIDNKLVTIADYTSSTYDEAKINYTVLSEKNWRNALVITNAFHQRRVRDVYHHLAKYHQDISLDIFACPNPPRVQNYIYYHTVREYIKTFYYWLYYGCKPILI